MFENLSIGIKTFLRDEQLFNTIQAIRENLPGAQMILADCGEMTDEKDGLYAELVREGHIQIDLPFDAGFGAMSNSIVDALQRPYLLMGSDDFDFSIPAAAHGIAALNYTLEYNRGFDIVSGRVNGNPYEFHLIERQPGEWYERPLIGSVYFTQSTGCDLTVNYFLARNKVFDTVRWDDDVKIGGGEHGAFFIDCKRAKFKTVFVPGVNINEQQVRNSPRYRMYRRRAQDPARPCFVRRGIKKYVMGNGVVDYDETGGSDAVR
jgi:hypothetical protein